MARQLEGSRNKQAEKPAHSAQHSRYALLR
jgi:hypothetical protein